MQKKNVSSCEMPSHAKSLESVDRRITTNKLDIFRSFDQRRSREVSQVAQISRQNTEPS